MDKATATSLQNRLNDLGYDAGPADGAWGRRSIEATKQFQRASGLTADGLPGPKTQAAIASFRAVRGDVAAPNRDFVPVALDASAAVRQWPTQAQCTSFYGPPGGPRCTAGIVRLPIPFRLAWDLDSAVNTFRCHDLVADAMTSIFSEAVETYGEGRFVDLRLDLFGGCYNLRKMRGGTSYSMHSWGIAVDLDPERNQLEWTKDKAAFAHPEYQPFWDIVQKHGAISLGHAADYDWMHFQFARLR